MNGSQLPARSPLYRALDAIERLGDRLPDPVFIFAWMIGALVVASVVCAGLGVNAVNPVNGEVLSAKSLLSSDNLRLFLTEMPKTLTSFPPLGNVLLIMLGAGVAEGSGLFSAAIRALLTRSPIRLITPVVILIGLVANHAADAGFVILVPLAGIVYAAAGRHPIAGMAAAFTGVAGSYVGNPTPGQFDALILGISEPAARLLDPTWTANIVGNWWFTIASGALFLPIAWFMTDKIIEPRLGSWLKDGDTPSGMVALTDRERKGLAGAGLAALALVAVWTALALWPNGPLVDNAAEGAERWTPFFRSLIAAFFFLFLVTGMVYGRIVGSVTDGRQVAGHAADAIRTMAPYVVLIFVAAHFIAMFGWSNLGAIIAINGAEALKASGLPIPAFFMALVLFVAFLDLFVGSASAKWAVLAPILVPMMMLVGISPEMTTAAYRMGDSTVNMASPLNPYFVLVLSFCQRWKPDFGVGGLLSVVLPYSAVLMACGALLTGLWCALELPTGPAAPVHYSVPGAISR